MLIFLYNIYTTAKIESNASSTTYRSHTPYPIILAEEGSSGELSDPSNY